jgi:hypothetical protein
MSWVRRFWSLSVLTVSSKNNDTTVCCQDTAHQTEYLKNEWHFHAFHIQMFWLLTYPLKRKHALCVKKLSNLNSILHKRIKHWKFWILAAVPQSSSWQKFNVLNFSCLHPLRLLVSDQFFLNIFFEISMAIGIAFLQQCIQYHQTVTGLTCFQSQTLPDSLGFSTSLNTVV